MLWNVLEYQENTKINLFQKNEERKVWREKGTAYDPKRATSCVKHGGGSVMVWACVAAIGTALLVFTDDATADKSSNMSSDMHKAKLYAHIQNNSTLFKHKKCLHINTKTYLLTYLLILKHTSPGKKPRIWWCPQTPDLRQSLDAKDFHSSIEECDYICNCVTLSKYVWTPENGGTLLRKNCL